MRISTFFFNYIYMKPKFFWKIYISGEKICLSKSSPFLLWRLCFCLAFLALAHAFEHAHMHFDMRLNMRTCVLTCVWTCAHALWHAFEHAHMRFDIRLNMRTSALTCVLDMCFDKCSQNLDVRLQMPTCIVTFRHAFQKALSKFKPYTRIHT